MSRGHIKRARQFFALRKSRHEALRVLRCLPRSKITRYREYGIAGLVLIGVILYLGVPASAETQSHTVAVNDSLTTSFSRPIGKLTYSLSPAVKGSWHVSRNIVGSVTNVSFHPNYPLRPNQRYSISLANMRTVLGMSMSPKVITFETNKLQPVELVSPVATNASTQTAVVVSMPSPNQGVRRLVLDSADAVLTSASPEISDDRAFTWHFAHALAQGVTYHLVLKDLNRPAGQQVVQNISFTTVSAPQVTSATTTNHLYPGQPITIVFAQAMTLSTQDFTFSCPGTGKWQSSTTYSYMPTTLPPATTCTYAVSKGARSTVGGVVEANQQFTTSSPGAVVVTSSSPSGSDMGLSTSVSMMFDQPVDHASAQSAFSMSPSASGSFSWTGNTMTFTPTGLSYQTTYVASVGQGIAATYGLPSAQSFSTQFTTLPQTIKLAVPGYKQQYILSCEESALRMALAYRGIMVSDMDVLQAENYDPQPRNTTTNTWQNPYETFVGNVNGTEDVTGWGAYGSAIAAAADKLGGNASYISGITVQQVSNAVHSNDPVVLWGMMPNETPRLDSWNTDTGIVTVVANAHVRTVYGVVGSASDPLGFYIHDPIFGDIYWSTATLEANMTANGLIGSQGVIVN
jgi:uncharacterized protein YvpB/nitrogen fixation protein FixH